jgi:uncharacterized membrane protein YqjE
MESDDGDDGGDTAEEEEATWLLFDSVIVCGLSILTVSLELMGLLLLRFFNVNEDWRLEVWS